MRNALLLVILSWPGCQSPPPPSPLKPVATVRQLMEGTVHPTSEVVFESVGTIITREGVREIAPANDEEWTNVWNNALTLAEAGNLLMIGDRPKDNGDWPKMARALVDAGVRAMNAAKAKNAQDLFDAGGAVYEACEQCHYRYRSDGRWKAGMRGATGN